MIYSIKGCFTPQSSGSMVQGIQCDPSKVKLTFSPIFQCIVFIWPPGDNIYQGQRSRSRRIQLIERFHENVSIQIMTNTWNYLRRMLRKLLHWTPCFVMSTDVTAPNGDRASAITTVPLITPCIYRCPNARLSTPCSMEFQQCCTKLLIIDIRDLFKDWNGYQWDNMGSVSWVKNKSFKPTIMAVCEYGSPEVNHVLMRE